MTQNEWRRRKFLRKLTFESLECRQLLSISNTAPAETLTGVTSPGAMVFDKVGDLFVADAANNSTTISEFAPGATVPTATLTGVSGPIALAVDSNNDLYVLNKTTSTISEFAPGGTVPMATLSGLSSPTALAIDSNGDLFVGETNIQQDVVEFAPGSTVPTSSLSAAAFVESLVVDDANNLYVGTQSGEVDKFAAGSTTISARLASPGGGFAQSLAVSPNGTLYVGYYLRGTVGEFLPGSTTAVTTLTGLSEIAALALDSNGDIYAVSGFPNDSVSVFTPGNTAPVGTLSGVNSPTSAVLDSSGNLYVANSPFAAAGSISVFAGINVSAPPTIMTSAGATIYAPNIGAQAVDAGITLSDTESLTLTGATVQIASGYVAGEDLLSFTSQNGITSSFNATTGTLTLSGTALTGNYQTALASVTYTDTQDNATTANRTVSFTINDGLNSSNTASKAIMLQAVAMPLQVNTVIGATLTGLTEPGALAFDKFGNLFVANSNGTTVSEFAPGQTIASATLSGVSDPTALVFDSSGNLYALNSSGNTVSEFAPGAITPTATLTGLNQADALAVDSKGDLFVGQDVINSNLLEFAPGSSTATATLTGAPAFVESLAIDSADNLYAGTQSGEIAKFTAGSKIANSTLSGAAFPEAMAIGPNNDLYVANHLAGTVQVYASGTTTPNITLTGLHSPDALAFDSAGNLYVANNTFSNDGVSVFSPGNTLPTVTLGGLNTPKDLAFDPQGNLFVSNDIFAEPGTVSEFFTVTPGPPALTASAGSLVYLPNSGAQAIDPNIALSDTESTTITSATVTISSGYVSGEDVLGFTSQNGISGAFNPATGAIILTGTASVANYRAALASITYTDTQQDATTANRTVSFTVGDGTSFSNTTTKTVSPLAVAPPFLTTSAGTLYYLANSGVQPINPAISLTDTESSTVTGATIAISSGYVQGEDVLGFTSQNGITGTFNSAAGTIILFGTSSVANYRSALASVTYTNTQHDATTANRTVSFTVFDGTNFSNTGTKTVSPQALVIQQPGGTTPSATLIGLNAPSLMTFDSNGNLFVSDSGDGSGTTVSEFRPGATTASATLSGVHGPTGLIFDSSGNLYVANFAGGVGSTVSKFAPGSTTPTATLVGLNNPEFMAFDSSGNLYVGNEGGNTVSVFAPGSTIATTTLTGVTRPRGLAFNSNGDLYVANNGGSTVSIFDPGSTTPSATLVGLSSPWTVAFDAAGNVYVANGGSGTISRFAPGSTTASATLTGLDAINDMLFDSRGNLYVANGGGSTAVSVFAPGATTATSQLTGPIGIFGLALDSAGNLYTADHAGTTVSVFDLGATTVATPLVTTSSGALSYQANSGDFAIDPGVALADAESTTLISATIAITSGYVPGEDLLSFTAENGITGSFNATAGTLVLSGSATIAEYQSALESVTYTDTQHDASTNNRTVSFSINDGTNSSNTATKIVAPHADVATQLVVLSELPTSITAGSPFGLTVVAEDALGNVTGFNGNVTVAVGDNPGGSTLGGIVTVSASTGIAAISGLTLNKAGSGYNLEITGAGLAPATTTLMQVWAGAIAQLGIYAPPPAAVVAGAPFGFAVVSEDAEGNPVSDFNGNVTVSLLDNPGGDSLAGTLTAPASNGLAIFSGLSLDKVAAGYSLQVSGASLASGATDDFAVLANTATQLVVISQPAATVGAGNAFGFTVAAEDAFGNLSNYTGDVSVALANNPDGNTLGGTQTVTAAGGLAIFSDLNLGNLGSGYTLEATTTGLSPATTASFDVGPGNVAITGSDSGTNDNVSVTFTDPTTFMVNVGGTSESYSTATKNQFVYNGPAGTFSEVVFDDPSNQYTVTQSLDGTELTSSSGFQLLLNNITNLYVYGNSGSQATVNVPSGAGNNFFVASVAGGYSYIADPVTGTYSELSGFGGVTVNGLGANTYAYVYSASNAQVVLSPGESTFTFNGVTSTLSDFPQVYVVGAADGTDKVTIDSSGGTFVSSPQFSYATGTANGQSFLLGAIYAANVTAQAAGPNDKAVFYSYANDTFAGTPGSSSLTGSATNVVGASITFVSQALGFAAVSVFESGSGTDVAHLTSTGNGSFYGTDLASVLTVGTNTITVNSFALNNSGTAVAVPAQMVLTGQGDGTDNADVYDDPGSNALTASNSTATFTTALGTLTINKFGSLTAHQEIGSTDTVHEAAIDFALKTVGNWTSV